jgi:hypothetical protein
MDPDPLPDATSVTRLVATAAEAASVHISDGDGWCAQCRRGLARLVWHPCPQAEWARTVIDKYDGPASDDTSEEHG